MRIMRSLLTLAVMLAFVPLTAADLPADIKAKFIRILATNAKSPSVDCQDSAVAAELAKADVKVDSSSKVAWASTEGEVKKLKAAKKLVICSKLEHLAAGGSIAVVEEGGKPAIYLHMGHIADSGITLSDAVLKIGKRM